MEKELMTVSDVAEKYKRHPVTVRNALKDGSLHGGQMRPRGSWRISEPCADAWISGAKCSHYSPQVNLMRAGRRSA